MLRLVLALAVVLAAIFVREARAAGLPENVGAQVPLGKNLTGDNCQLRVIALGAFEGAAGRYLIFCEGWDQPSGQVVKIGVGRRNAKYWIEESGWIQYFENNGICDATQPQSLIAGQETVMRRCTAHAGYLRLMLVSKGDGYFYIADFLPTNAPLIERTIEVAAGKRQLDAAPPEGTRMANMRAVEELVGQNGRLASIGDVGLFRKLYDLAIQQNQARLYRKAELNMRRALEVQERMMGPNNPSLAETLQQLTHDLRNQRRFEATEEVTDRAEPLAQKSGDPNIVADQYMVRSYNAGVRDPEAAKRFAEQAIAAVNPMIRGQGSTAADAYFTLGLAQTRVSPASAEDALRHSLQLYERFNGVNYVWTNRSRMFLAGSLVEQKKLQEAKPLIDQAEAVAELLYGRTIWWGNAKIVEADYHLANGNEAAALDAYRAYGTVAAREQFSCYFSRCISAYVDLLLRLAAKNPGRAQEYLAEAFSVVQLGDSTIVNTAVSKLAARVAADNRDIEAVTRRQQDIAEQEQRLRAQLGAEVGKPQEQRNAQKEAELRKSIDALSAQGEAQEVELQAKFPRYAQLVTHRALKLSDVAPLLKPDEGLLIYADMVAKGASLLLHGGKIEMVSVAMTSDQLFQRVALLRAGLTVEGSRLPEFDTAAAYSLFNDTFAKVLQNAPEVKRLIFVPTGAFLSLPPEVLVTEPPAGAHDYAAAAWLVRKYSVVVSPSIRAFAELRKAGPPQKTDLGFLGIGNPIFAANAPKAKSGTEDDPCDERRNLRAVVARLPALPETTEEVRALASEAGKSGSKLLLAKDATKGQLRGAGLDRARVVAFATHGLLPSDLICEAEPALALTPGPSNSPDDDGLLKASDITALKVDASLVILSACNTAGADGRLSGESLSGLVRAFFFAGARNVLATHWPIASKPTVALTTGTVADALKHGDDWAGGLRDAQLKMLQDPKTAHPLLWGAFVLVGAG